MKMRRVTIEPSGEGQNQASVLTDWSVPATDEYLATDPVEIGRLKRHTGALLSYLVAGGEALKIKFSRQDRLGDGSDMIMFDEILESIEPGAGEGARIRRRVEVEGNVRRMVRVFLSKGRVWVLVEMVADRLLQGRTIEGESLEALREEVQALLP